MRALSRIVPLGRAAPPPVFKPIVPVARLEERTYLTFEDISPRAWRAIERAGGSVFEQRSRRRRLARYLVAMPPGANWYRGLLVETRQGPRPHPTTSAIYKDVVHFWPVPCGRLCVVVRDEDDRLWHHRDRQCPATLPF